MRKNTVISLTSLQRTLLLVLLAFATASVAVLVPLTRAQEAQKLSAPAVAPSPSNATAAASDPKPVYPVTKKIEHVDTYHNEKIVDPYRWLEDENSPETAAWVEAQNRVTFGYLEKIPFRAQIAARLEKLFNYPKYSSPSRRGEHFFFFKNDGLQNQSVLYIQKGLDGTPEVLIDPNKFSADGTSRLGTFSLSTDGKTMVYGISKGGSDWQEYFVMVFRLRRHNQTSWSG